MRGSFGKRARALLVFTTGLMPFTPASAQGVPACTQTIPVSKKASATAELFRQDSDPTVRAGYGIVLLPTKSSSKDKALLAGESAKLTITYAWGINGLVQRDFFIRSPFPDPTGQDPKPAYDITIDLAGDKNTIDYDTQYNYLGQAGFYNWNGGEKFGSLKKDFTVAFARTNGDRKTTSFTYSGKDAKKAFTGAKGMIDKLLKRADAGECNIPTRTTPSSGGSGCFLTTATCEAVGLADDCWELRTLRKFRDGWLADQQGGMDDIKAYYAKAPAIAERLKQDPQALLRLYWTRIVPSALAAQIGANRLARSIYSKGMRELATA